MGELVNSYRFRQLGVPVFLPARIAVSGLENLGLGTNSKRNHLANQQRHLWTAKRFSHVSQSFRTIKKPLFQCLLFFHCLFLGRVDLP